MNIVTNRTSLTAQARDGRGSHVMKKTDLVVSGGHVGRDRAGARRRDPLALENGRRRRHARSRARVRARRPCRKTSPIVRRSRWRFRPTGRGSWPPTRPPGRYRSSIRSPGVCSTSSRPATSPSGVALSKDGRRARGHALVWLRPGRARDQGRQDHRGRPRRGRPRAPRRGAFGRRLDRLRDHRRDQRGRPRRCQGCAR